VIRFDETFTRVFYCFLDYFIMFRWFSALL
jgi:hypothetical protein